MVLTLPLARMISGSKLIEVVSEAMKEIEGGGWKFEEKTGAELSELWGYESFCHYNKIKFTSEKEKVREFGNPTFFYNYGKSKNSNETVFLIERKNENYNMCFGASLICAPIAFLVL